MTITTLEEGDNIVTVVKPKRVMFPLFEIAANPEIPLTEIKARRFDLIERSVDLGSAQIMAEEDRKIFTVMDAVCDDPSSPNQDIAVTGILNGNALPDAFAAIEEHDIRVRLDDARLLEGDGLQGVSQLLGVLQADGTQQADLRMSELCPVPADP